MLRIRQGRWGRVVIPLGVLGVLLLASLACVGGGANLDGLNVQNNYTLKSGEQRDGDQVIVASRIYLDPGSVVTGDTTLIGDQVQLDAEMRGDVVVIADRLEVGDSARIDGDLVYCVDRLSRGPGAEIAGSTREQCDNGSPISATRTLQSGVDRWNGNFPLRLLSAIAGALLVGALAALSTILFPGPLVRLSDSIRAAPGITGGMGCLTVLVAVGLTLAYLLSLILVVPLVLLPFLLIGWLVIGLSCLLGWLALAEPFGRFVFRRLHLEAQPPMVAAAVGGAALTLLVRVWGVFVFTEWIGLLLMAIFGSIGLGAVVLTRMGTRVFPRPRPVAEPLVVNSRLE